MAYRKTSVKFAYFNKIYRQIIALFEFFRQ